MAIRLLIVDQHDLHRVALASLLAAEQDLDVVAHTSAARTAVRLAAELRPDVVLIDPQLADVDAAARGILQQEASVRLLALSVLAADSDITAALRAGFCGYLSKDSPIDDLVGAVRAAAHGAAWLAPTAAQAILSSLSHTDHDAEPTAGGLNTLSRPEIEVLQILAHAQDNQQIAPELSISPQSTDNHVSSILSKLALKDFRLDNPAPAGACAALRHRTA